MALVSPPDEPTFYMTVGSNRKQIKGMVEDGSIPVMRNVMQFRNNDETLVDRSIDAARYVLDSGGYTAMDRFGGDFPWTVAEYHEWAQAMYARKPFDWIAVMDLACEPAFDDVISVEERITRTIENTVALLDHDPEYPVLPVLQGRTVDQWLDCYDRLRERGINPDYAGIGTLCRQTSGRDIRDIARAIRTRTDIKAFHGFGVKATAFKHGAKFETADSQAWSWPVKYGIKLTLDNNEPPRLHREKYDDDAENVHGESFKSYYTHAHRLQREAYTNHNHKQIALGEY